MRIHLSIVTSNTPENFYAGKISENIHCWREITSDPWVLNIVKGISIPFNEMPLQTVFPKPIHFSDSEKLLIGNELQTLIQKGVIEQTHYNPDGFVSNIFMRQKKDGSVRVILNLKRLNEYVKSDHFKMDTLKSAVKLMKPGVYFASCDLRDAYYSIRIRQESRKYLQFFWDNKCFQFTCLCNGLKLGPMYFTKLLKCVFSQLRKKGHINTGYIDDSLLQADTYSDCEKNVQDTVYLFDGLGLTVHPIKSVFIPTQIIEFLGFVLNSVEMAVSLSVEKADKITHHCNLILQKQQLSIRELSELIGKLVACSPAVPHAALFYKRLEIYRNVMLKQEKGNYDSQIVLTQAELVDITWWRDNIKGSKKLVYISDPDCVIFTDSSLSGWGGVMSDISTGGQWDSTEREEHINYLELKAVLLSLQSFCREMSSKHIRIRSDNTVTVVCINKQGSTKVLLNDMTREIWSFAMERSLWLSAEHVVGRDNIADEESRKNDTDTEWMLKTSIFNKITELFCVPDIDLFATRVNHQVPCYFSWKPDPHAVAIDAFNQSWKQNINYLFPPFSVIGSALQKIEQDTAEGILVAPLWPTQVWFPKLLSMLISCPFLLPVAKDLVTLPGNTMVHPLLKRLHLTVFRISGKVCKQKAYQQMLSTSFCSHGKVIQKSSMGVISKNGCVFAMNGKLIPFHQM